MRVFPLFLLVGGLLAAATISDPAAAQNTQSPINIPIPQGMNGKGGLEFNYPPATLTVKSVPVKAGTLINYVPPDPLPVPPPPPEILRHNVDAAAHPLSPANRPPFLEPPEGDRQIDHTPNMAATLKVKGGPWKGTWKLDHFHFHQRSEHKVNGNHFDMELHLVHYRIPNPANPNHKEYLAVGRFIETVDENNSELFNELFDNLYNHPIPFPPPPPPDYVSGLLNLKELLPTSSFRNYRYFGSLTTGPPISDTPVRWIVFDEPLGLTAAQIADFRNHEARGTVRKVWEPGELIDVGLPSHVNVQGVVPEPSTVWLLVIAGLVTVRHKRRSVERTRGRNY